jgi:hypothetical protein
MNSPLQFTAKLEAHVLKEAWIPLVLPPKQCAALKSKSQGAAVCLLGEQIKFRDHKSRWNFGTQ